MRRALVVAWAMFVGVAVAWAGPREGQEQGGQQAAADPSEEDSRDGAEDKVDTEEDAVDWELWQKCADECVQAPRKAFEDALATLEVRSDEVYVLALTYESNASIELYQALDLAKARFEEAVFQFEVASLAHDLTTFSNCVDACMQR